jgi:hypothetical protein
MKLTIEPTEDFFVADDVMVRMWTGTDDNGTPVVALVAAVAVNDGSPRATTTGRLSSPSWLPSRSMTAAHARQCSMGS